MRILITNDDGINAPGLEVLAEIAAEIAGPEGEVWTVAPAFEQSGVGHCISYTHPTLIAELGERRFAAEGTPADCVLAGLHYVLGEAKPDLVLSGVNKGNNSAENVLYSGTIGAAMEGALQGVKSIALSQYFGPDNAKLDDPFEAARQHSAPLIRRLLERGDWGGEGYQTFYNVNFPPCPGAEVKGMLAVAQGRRPGVNFTAEPHMAPNRRQFLWIKGGAQHGEMPLTSDAGANLAGYVSVTPLRADLTAHDELPGLSEALR